MIQGQIVNKPKSGTKTLDKKSSLK